MATEVMKAQPMILVDSRGILDEMEADELQIATGMPFIMFPTSPLPLGETSQTSPLPLAAVGQVESNVSGSGDG